jgi:ADP-ribose pyrophosphatase
MADITTHKTRPAGALSEPQSHNKARSERPTDYPERFPVPDHLVRWRSPYPDYAPPRYDSPSTLAKSPDPLLFSDLQRTLASYEPGGIRIDGATGEPLNPRGRTGISGRGGLYLWGPNHAADLLLTRFNLSTNSLEALLIQRKSGQWAIPGGMVDAGETASRAAMRELKEEAGISATTSEKTRELYRGYVDDPRNTDNAWMETVVFHEHLGEVNPLPESNPTAGSDAQAAQWTPLTRDLINGLYASHPSFVQSGLEALLVTPGTSPQTRTIVGELLDVSSAT